MDPWEKFRSQTNITKNILEILETQGRKNGTELVELKSAEMRNSDLINQITFLLGVGMVKFEAPNYIFISEEGRKYLRSLSTSE